MSSLFQAKRDKGLKIAVGMEQWHLIEDTPGRNQTVDGFAHSDALRTQMAIEGRALAGICFAHHVHHQKDQKGILKRRQFTPFTNAL